MRYRREIKEDVSNRLVNLENQAAWRERHRCNIEGDPSSSPVASQTPSSLSSRMFSRSAIASVSSCSSVATTTVVTSSSTSTVGNNNSLMADGGGGPEPMDESGDAFGGVGGRDVPGAESGSDAGGGGSGSSVVAGLTLAPGASAEERATREERAAKALQSAARVMLARKGRFQRLARETRALLIIQRRSREWLKHKQTSESDDVSTDVPFSQGL